MNLAHLHLILNHVPVVGVGLAFVLLLYGTVRRSDELIKASLLGVVALALVAIPAYLTGEPAEKILASHATVSGPAVERHEDAAGVALAGIEVMGVIALVMLIFFRRRPVPLRASASVLVLSLVLSGMMAWTANLGGKIHHTEAGGTTIGGVAAQPEHDD